jgi:hypothetical protein
MGCEDAVPDLPAELANHQLAEDALSGCRSQGCEQQRTYFAGLSQTVTMLGVSEKLAANATDRALPQLGCVHKTVSLVARIRKRLSWLVHRPNGVMARFLSHFVVDNRPASAIETPENACRGRPHFDHEIFL